MECFVLKLVTSQLIILFIPFLNAMFAIQLHEKCYCIPRNEINSFSIIDKMYLFDRS